MKYGILKQYIEKYNLKFEIIPIVKKSHICEVVGNHLFDFDHETKLGYKIVVNNIHHRKNGEWQYFWFETLLPVDELEESTEVSFEYRYSQINAKTDKSMWTKFAVENRIEKDIQKEGSEKETAINVVKETINNDSICGNSFYKVVFNDDLDDSLTVDEYSNNNEKESTLKEIESRKKEITFIGYFEGSYEKVFFGNLPESSEDEKKEYNNTNNKDMKKDNLEISNFVGKKYVSEYTINGNEYKSIITVLAQNYGLLEIKREVFQNGKKSQTIEKSIKLSRIREGLKTGFYKEYTEPETKVTLYDALKNDAVYTYHIEDGKTYVITNYKGKQFKTDLDRFNQVLDKVELDISIQDLTQNKPFK